MIIRKCEWDIHRDEGWGWCGKERDDHVCDPTFVHNVGSDDNAYARLVDAFNQNRVAGFARVIMLNPIHKDLSPFVILLQAVCNKFDHMMVRNQWSSITDLYNQYLLDVLGPLVGHASDGDVRRRKLHLEDSNSVEGVRYSIDHENFIFSGRLDEVNGKKFVVDLSDQDYVHNGKKIVNHLMHPSRVLSLGGNLCFMNHLQLLVNNEHMSSFDHGLQQPDIERRDRMNWESTQ